ncbi:hypothetical protein ACN469_15035 [Corallococcus terminator]
MRQATIAIAVIAGLLLSGCSRWWVYPMLPSTPNPRSLTQKPGGWEEDPVPTSEPVYGPDRASEAPDAEKEESKPADEAP